jgi:hypothetical protein
MHWFHIIDQIEIWRSGVLLSHSVMHGVLQRYIMTVLAFLNRMPLVHGGHERGRLVIVACSQSLQSALGFIHVMEVSHHQLPLLISCFIPMLLIWGHLVR